MKKLILALFLLSSGYSFAQGYKIDLTLKPYANQKVYLGYYYGNLKALQDSVVLGADYKGSFSGPEPLPGGIYFIVSPSKQILFELLIDNDQQFSIQADTLNLPEGVIFSGSSDNEKFAEYTGFASKAGRAISQLNMAYHSARTKKDSAAIRTRSKQLNEQLQQYRDSLSLVNPTGFLAALFNAMREPKIPPASLHPGGKYDSAFAFRFYKDHYWDGVSFSDDRLVRTPFFEQKLIKYYKELVVPQPDTLNGEIDAMLLQARGSKEMFKFLMVHFVQKYINPEYMGEDAVFVHLFDKYINTGQAGFFTDKYREFIDKRAYSLMANLIGKPAPNLEMVDSLGNAKPLYKTSGKFTVIVFWDPTCGHCQEIVPKVDSIYQAKWKQEGVVLYGVKVDGSRAEWTKFIHDHNLKDWIHVYQTDAQADADIAAARPGFRQLYDVYQTPILYLLDKDKRIIAKKVTYQQIDDVIALKMKNP